MNEWVKLNWKRTLITTVVATPIYIAAIVNHIEPKKPDTVFVPTEYVGVQQSELSFEAVEKEVEELETISIGEFKLTAYCSCEKCCCSWAKKRPVDEDGNQIVYGASGAVLEPGKSIAVDPKKIPYGTNVIINGRKYRADDCGGAIKGNHIDVYFSNHDEAVSFGVQKAELFVEQKGEEESE